MRISARADYALRAAAELAAAEPGRFVKGETIAAAQRMPHRFVENILGGLAHAGLVESQRGADGGYRLARPAQLISLADVIRAVEGPLATVRGAVPEAVDYHGHATALRDVWFAVRANLRAVAEHVSVADLAAGTIPARIAEIAADPDARRRRAAPVSRSRARRSPRR
ncbi:MAG TPA: Rrf2 family transcriptional regulator [Capillimicrobium sp.]|nr:Rrf2 family transcriptional regulator [Capillimicrobium sp.]